MVSRAMETAGKKGQARIFRDFAARVPGTRTVEGLLELLHEVGQPFGMSHVSIANDVLNDRPLLSVCGERLVDVVLGWPSELTSWWYGHDMTRHCKDTRKCLHERMPFTSGLLESDDDLAGVDLVIARQIRRFGFRSSIFVPVHNPDGVTSMVNWCSNDPEASSRMQDHWFDLLGTAHAFVDAFARVKGEGRQTRENVLTPRQIDCLRLAARGKTAKEIAIIMSLSPHTVEEYLKEACRRTGTRGRSGLIAHAWQHGIIKDLT